jgi:hypothetical protein
MASPYQVGIELAMASNHGHWSVIGKPYLWRGCFPCGHCRLRVLFSPTLLREAPPRLALAVE